VIILKKRVYEIAKEHGLKSTELVTILQENGHPEIKHYSNKIEEDIVLEIIAPKLKNEEPPKPIKHKEPKKNIEKKEKSKLVKEPVKAQEEPKKKAEKAPIPKQEVKKEEPKEETDTKNKITLPSEISVDALAEKINTPKNKLVLKLMELGVMNLKQPIEFDIAAIISEEFGFNAELESDNDEEEFNFKEEDLEHRPPVVTIMGHVDHGKTTLLDFIRKSRITSGEAGGITQHIGAYKVFLDKKHKKSITFIDTPGHEAFTAMRAHGAKVTDIAILIVAADDGVKPQTIEAIDHAKAAQVPIIVAVNKIDKPEANPDRVKQELSNHGVLAEDWGGDTIFVEISAKTGQNVDELLDMISLQAEMMELKANYKVPAVGVVIESKLDKGLGPVATILIQHGVLKVGQTVVIGEQYGKIRKMRNELNQTIKEAKPCDPVEIAGLSGVPNSGERMKVLGNEKQARELLKSKGKKDTRQKVSRATSLDEIFTHIKNGEIKYLNLIVKSDVHGSSVAIADAISRLTNDEVKVNIVHRGVGAITETDVMLATASSAIIIGFNVRPMSSAIKLAEKNKIEIRSYKIIYEIIEDVKKALSGLLTPDYNENITGHAEIRQIFKISRIGTIAGCYVTDGTINRNCNARLIRDGKEIYNGKLSSLKRFKDDVKEVAQGYECGISIENYNDLKESDIIEAYIIEEVAKEFVAGDNLE
jgi:translation initiation factor IF-2